MKTPTDTERIAALEVRMTTIETNLEENTRLTRELHAYLMTGKRAIGVINWTGRAIANTLVFIGKVGSAALAAYGVWWVLTHPGSAPPKP